MMFFRDKDSPSFIQPNVAQWALSGQGGQGWKIENIKWQIANKESSVCDLLFSICCF